MEVNWNLHVLVKIALIASVQTFPRTALSHQDFVLDPSSQYFDVLVFTQQWPKSACFAHQKKGGTSCNLPKHDRWTIHGLWPTELYTKNPQFCNNNWNLDVLAQADLENELKAKWITIDGQKSPHSFWKYQWQKHGTCSTLLKELDSPEKYFKKALELNDVYNIQNILKKVNIVPGKSYPPQTIFNGVSKVLGRRGQVACINNSERNESYLWEIRVCFDKSLDLIDCKGYTTNCSPTRNVIYPANPPPT